jgi:hypothetical protein
VLDSAYLCLLIWLILSAERASKLVYTASDPEVITKQIETLLTDWQKLPVLEQKEFILDLLDEVMRSSYRTEFREAIDIRWPVKPGSLHATFALVSLDYGDLKQAHLDDEEISQLNDDNLVEIAGAIRNHFVHNVFWDEVEYVAREMLEQREG